MVQRALSVPLMRRGPRCKSIIEIYKIYSKLCAAATCCCNVLLPRAAAALEEAIKTSRLCSSTGEIYGMCHRCRHGVNVI